MPPSPTGSPIIPPQYVPFLVLALMSLNGTLVAIQQNVTSPTAKLVCTILLATLAPVLAALSPGWRRKDGDVVALSKKLGSSGAVKALLLVLGLGVLAPAPARAAGWDWSSGPTIPVMVYTFGSPTPVQVAPGAGLQLSVTHDALKVDILGKSWDLLDGTAMVFGSLVNPGGPHQFGTLSAALGPCILSSVVCVGFGKTLLGPDSVLAKGGWFWTLALSFNWAIAPVAPSTLTESWHLPRANTMYLFGGP